ncbi:phage terminase small subunit [Metabacillus litoralis]|uniref:phage terminase small subunit n=1 Tax=Metabacillus litoralis TaxID=152268 RepID=UPI00203B1792|nr:phage terminase small subunit [Metabacillus litoralis]MCM3413536.1 phage terminase small subunit [Metabacillus litoralis]
MVNWEEIRKEYESTNITLKALADKHDLKDSTLRSRKNREKWQRNATTQQKNVATKKDSKKPRYPNGHPGNKNPKNQFSERNQAARKHGLFSRYMPKSTLEILEKVAGSDPVDLLWMQIELQFAAIIRSQEIMFVENKNEMIKELKKHKPGEYGDEVEFEFQFAWDRQATFLNAQSKAMAELRGSIKQFEELANSDDERRLKLEQMRLSIEKTKAEVENLSDDKEEGPIEIVIKRKER